VLVIPLLPGAFAVTVQVLHTGGKVVHTSGERSVLVDPCEKQSGLEIQKDRTPLSPTYPPQQLATRWKPVL
jgi:hypothetical protein